MPMPRKLYLLTRTDLNDQQLVRASSEEEARYMCAYADDGETIWREVTTMAQIIPEEVAKELIARICAG